MTMHTEAMSAYAPEHPAFAGHFPGRPIVPGVLLLDAALHALGADQTTCRIVNAKFLRPVPPDTHLQLQSEDTSPETLRFSVGDNGGNVASGQVQIVPIAAEPGP